jgi:hypothetical protein
MYYHQQAVWQNGGFGARFELCFFLLSLVFNSTFQLLKPPLRQAAETVMGKFKRHSGSKQADHLY